MSASISVSKRQQFWRQRMENRAALTHVSADLHKLFVQSEDKLVHEPISQYDSDGRSNDVVLSSFEEVPISIHEAGARASPPDGSKFWPPVEKCNFTTDRTTPTSIDAHHLTCMILHPIYATIESSSIQFEPLHLDSTPRRSPARAPPYSHLPHHVSRQPCTCVFAHAKCL
jgi:hypothetical protein